MVFESPGIYWDPREPIPPEVRRRLELEENVARFQHRPPRHLRRHAENYRVVRDPGPFFNPVDLGDRVAAQENIPRHPRQQVDDFATPIQDEGFLPPMSVALKAQLVQDTAQVSITQLFSNESACAIPKASYTFPLPQGCTVTEFVCHVGSNKILRGEVKPKQGAFESFNEAVGRNETAALLDQSSPEIFTTTLGNIPARCRLKVEIKFIFLLTYKFEGENGLTTFTLPTYIAPRFGTPPPSLWEALRASVDARSLSMEIDILAPEEILSIKCDTHPIRVEMGVSGRSCQTWQEFVESGQREDTKAALVHLAEDITHLDRDFVLEIETVPESGLEKPQACVETHPQLPNHRALMLTIPPNFMPGVNSDTSSDHSGSEIIFVADRSGSMEDKILALKSAMQFFLRGIPSNRRFNIWCFGDRFENLWDHSLAYTQNNLQEALGYVTRSFSANLGGTRLLPALKAVVAARRGFQTTDIVTLTDGQVWDLDDTLEFVKKTRRTTESRVRFFSLGIGTAVSHALVEGIAKLGGGYAEVIPLASEGGWESRVVAVLKAALTDHAGIVDIEIDSEPGAVGLVSSMTESEIGGSDGNYLHLGQKMMQSPAQAFTLSPFVRNRVYMLFEALESQVSLRGVRLRTRSSGAEDVITWVPAKVLRLPDTTIHKLAARALLGDLERGQSQIHLGPQAASRTPAHEKAMVTLEGERLGCKWSLVSKWTSFFAVEKHLQLAEVSQDPFLDNGDNNVSVVSQGDLGLLRPRGMQESSSARITEAVGVSEVEDEDVDTTDSGSEHDFRGGWRGWGYDDDSDNDDYGGGSGGGGGTANGTSGNGSGYTGHGGYGSGAHGANSGGSQTTNSQGGTSQNTSFQGHFRASQSASPYVSADFGPGSQTTIKDQVYRGLTKPSVAYGSPIPPTQPSVAYGPPIPPMSRKARLDKPLFDTSRYSKSSLPSKSSKAHAIPTSSKLKGNKEPDTLWDPLPISMDSPLKSPPSPDLTAYLNQTQPSASQRSRGLFSSTTHKDVKSSKFKTLGDLYQISVPHSNLPASSAMLQPPSTMLRSVEDEAKDQYIGKLLSFQKHNGSFVLPDADIILLLGQPFLDAVNDLEAVLEQKHVLWGSPELRQLALTAAIIAQLETQLASRRSLWELMAVKGKDYIKGYGVYIDSILTDARDCISSAGSRWVESPAIGALRHIWPIDLDTSINSTRANQSLSSEVPGGAANTDDHVSRLKSISLREGNPSSNAGMSETHDARKPGEEPAIPTPRLSRLLSSFRRSRFSSSKSNQGPPKMPQRIPPSLPTASLLPDSTPMLSTEIPSQSGERWEH